MHRSDDAEGDGRPETPEDRARREAAELMAGFDRPGRTPRRADGRDFVDHFGGASAGPVRGHAHVAAPLRRIASPGSLLGLSRVRLPASLAWLLLAVGIALGVTALAWAVTGDDALPARSPRPEGAPLRTLP